MHVLQTLQMIRNAHRVGVVIDDVGRFRCCVCADGCPTSEMGLMEINREEPAVEKLCDLG